MFINLPAVTNGDKIDMRIETKEVQIQGYTSLGTKLLKRRHRSLMYFMHGNGLYKDSIPYSFESMIRTVFKHTSTTLL